MKIEWEGRLTPARNSNHSAGLVSLTTVGKIEIILAKCTVIIYQDICLGYADFSQLRF